MVSFADMTKVVGGGGVNLQEAAAQRRRKKKKGTDRSFSRFPWPTTPHLRTPPKTEGEASRAFLAP
jgi:hypothetical protein